MDEAGNGGKAPEVPSGKLKVFTAEELAVFDRNPLTLFLEQAAQRAYQASVEHGFSEDWSEFGTKIALMHAELSEALEGYRKNQTASDHIPDFTPVEEEFADVYIRIMSFCAANKLRLGQAVLAKMAFNAGRPFKHGGKKF